MSIQPTTLDHLRALVAFDTRNPPRAIDTGGLFDYLATHLRGFNVQVDDHGDGCINLLAVRGTPRVLFNFHVDTVPLAKGWKTEPFTLHVENDRAYGLGACDIKGAAAGMLSAAAETAGDAALLFSSDEEAGNSRCIRSFLSQQPDFDAVVVAEPTQGKAVAAHRGIVSALMQFTGKSGHASGSAAVDQSALHRAVRWSSAALALAQSYADSTAHGLSGIRFNIGRIEGGIKPNMIADSAELRFGVRTLPGQDRAALLQSFFQLAEPHELAAHSVTFEAPALAGDPGLTGTLGLPAGQAVDFWTEAALFAEAGLPALVYGPGNIAQAHNDNEWVALAQLEDVTAQYKRLLS